MALKLARINAAEAKIAEAQAKIDELAPMLEEAKQKEASAAQTVMAKAKNGEDTRQYIEAQKKAREIVQGLSSALTAAQADLAAANDARQKA